VVLYTRQRCGLCAGAEALIRAELGRHARLRTVDVDRDDALVERYGVRVPVVAVDGVEVAELEVGRGVVRRAVREARRGAVLGPGDGRA
jgi:hypothetical protein